MLQVLETQNQFASSELEIWKRAGHAATRVPLHADQASSTQHRPQCPLRQCHAVPDYIQHSAHIEAGRDGLFTLIRALLATLRYDNAHAIASRDIVILHGRFSGHDLHRNWVVADIVRMEEGVLVEHWDVIQDEATEAESKSGLPMFGSAFGPIDQPS